MTVTAIDHLVLYASDVDRLCAFYTETLGMATVEKSSEDRIALSFGSTSLKLNVVGNEYDPHAQNPTVGSASFCVLVDEPISALADRFREEGISIVLGPVETIGAQGTLDSVYVEDPDGNLVEFAQYQD